MCSLQHKERRKTRIMLHTMIFPYYTLQHHTRREELCEIVLLHKFITLNLKTSIMIDMPISPTALHSVSYGADKLCKTFLACNLILSLNVSFRNTCKIDSGSTLLSHYYYLISSRTNFPHVTYHSSAIHLLNRDKHVIAFLQ